MVHCRRHYVRAQQNCDCDTEFSYTQTNHLELHLKWEAIQNFAISSIIIYENSQIGRCIAFAFSITSNINVLNLA